MMVLTPVLLHYQHFGIHTKKSVCAGTTSRSSANFCIYNGTRQGGILSPILFIRHIRELLQAIIDTRIGCNVGGLMMNVLAYADGIVLLAPSRFALQTLLDVQDINIRQIDITCNASKTVCMVFKPICRQKVVCDQFPAFFIIRTIIRISSFSQQLHV